MQHLYAVIMAGGAGKRFWPLSRRDTPKQFLPLGRGEGSLLARTAARLEGLVPADRVYVVTAEHLVDATRRELPDMPAENILAEPVGRNTAPCIGWAAATIRRRDPEAILAVLPADHEIENEPEFRAVLERAAQATQAGDLVTVGLSPTRPETGYGYIEMADEISPGVHAARRFVEKPTHARAERFLASGDFLWNGGIFLFQAAAILEAISESLPSLGAALAEFDAAAERGEEAALVAARYAELPSVSIDHGVMEKARRVLVVPADFGWSDLGSWVTAWEQAPKDDHQNAAPEGSVLLDAKGCYVRVAEGKRVALVGVEDLVVVDTPDALLIMPRARAQEVRQVVELLTERGEDQLV
ncbi:MAG: NTP transferase domain-containing protein [Deltaproteobacteria bacterium]|nr:NTP transferase domain-containing protein [Deltaproteobacteria bacterium]